MAANPDRSGFGWGALVLGLALGLIVGAGGTWLALRPEPTESPWVATSLAWTRLPQRTAEARPLPQSFAVPKDAFDYAAISQPLGALLQLRPTVLRVEAEATGARAGISLVTPDGQTIVSPERPVDPGEGPTQVYFALTSGLGPVAILLRNYDSPGQTGTVTVRAVDYAREDLLDPSETERIDALP